MAQKVNGVGVLESIFPRELRLSSSIDRRLFDGYVASYPGAVPVITISSSKAALKGRLAGSMLPPTRYGELYGLYKTPDKNIRSISPSHIHTIPDRILQFKRM